MTDKPEIKRLSRLTAILTLLQSKRIVSATEISEKFQISKRTAYRDIKALESSGIPIFTEEGKGYSLMEGYNLSPVMFTEQEANALITAEKLITNNTDESFSIHFKEAIVKIKAKLRYSHKDRVNFLSDKVIFFKNNDWEITSNNLSLIQKVIIDFSLIEIEYKAKGEEKSTNRKVEAMALYNTNNNWILIAWCHLRNNFREFRLDRISSVNVINQQFEDRKFDLIKYLSPLIEKNCIGLP